MKRPYPVWDPAIDDVFICTAVREVGAGVKTVVLAPRHPSIMIFDAGQYVTIEFDVAGVSVVRSYTIASPPTRPERIAITVKRTGAGRVSRWLHDGGIRPGTTVRIGEPQGAFTRSAHPARSCLLLTAGAGITPALSMLRESYDLSDAQDIVLVHSQRRLADVPYGAEISWMAQHLPGFRVEYVCSETDGRLGFDLLRRLVPDAADREIFICGPDSYRAMARSAALAVGGQPGRVHEETFVHGAPTVDDARTSVDVPFAVDDLATAVDDLPLAVEPSRSSAPAGTFRIQFRDHNMTIDCASDMTVLDAAAAAGLTLPSSCAQGLCGTCKSTLVAGQVDMQHGGGIRPREIAAGKVLLCCSRPLTDLVIAAP